MSSVMSRVTGPKRKANRPPLVDTEETGPEDSQRTISTHSNGGAIVIDDNEDVFIPSKQRKRYLQDSLSQHDVRRHLSSA